VQVSCSKGEKHCFTLCVCDNGKAYAWGDPYKGQLGTLPLGTSWTHEVQGMRPQPEAIALPDDIQAAKVITGGIHGSLLTTDGQLFTWGCGSDGRLGHPEYEGFVYLYKESHAKKVEFFGNTPVKDMASAYYFMTCLS